MVCFNKVFQRQLMSAPQKLVQCLVRNEHAYSNSSIEWKMSQIHNAQFSPVSFAHHLNNDLSLIFFIREHISG